MAQLWRSLFNRAIFGRKIGAVRGELRHTDIAALPTRRHDFPRKCRPQPLAEPDMSLSPPHHDDRIVRRARGTIPATYLRE